MSPIMRKVIDQLNIVWASFVLEIRCYSHFTRAIDMPESIPPIYWFNNRGNVAPIPRIGITTVNFSFLCPVFINPMVTIYVQLTIIKDILYLAARTY
jgi:hypothetical protein